MKSMKTQTLASCVIPNDAVFRNRSHGFGHILMTASANHNENVAVHVRNIGDACPNQNSRAGGRTKAANVHPDHLCFQRFSTIQAFRSFSFRKATILSLCHVPFFSGMLCRKADRAIFTKHFAAPHAACHKFCPTTVGRHNDCYQHMSQFFSICFSIFFQRSFSPTKSLARDILTRQPPGNAIYHWQLRMYRRNLATSKPQLLAREASNSSSQERLSRVVLHPNEPKFASPNGRNAEKANDFF